MAVQRVSVVGGGLAGSEAAWQLAQRGLEVDLFEMRPAVSTGAHQGKDLAELVCSNSLGSMLPDRASGILMTELRRMGSLLLEVAGAVAVPAGGALAVDRAGFSQRVTARLSAQPLVTIHRQEVKRIPAGLTVLASGPLTSESLAQELARLMGERHLYFFDALAPIVERDSVDMSIAFRASRYGRGQREEGDYINCPLSETEYQQLVEELLQAERIPLRSFEREIVRGVRAGMHSFFEGCLPIEVIAKRGRDALAFGPMRPVGLEDPRTGERPFAVVQLRQDDRAGELYNLVGFQTNLRFSEQRRVLRMIPGLERARFVRYGQMHRNTFVNSPKLLRATLQTRADPQLLLAGQITGVEGYLGNIGTGLLAGVNAGRLAFGLEPLQLPRETMMGSLVHYVTTAEPKRFQPMKANLGILPPLKDPPRTRRQRARAHAQRSAAHIAKLVNRGESLMRIGT